MILGGGNLFENTGNPLGRPTAAKPGTTDTWKNIWTMGYTTDCAIGVWTGQTTQSGNAEIELPTLDGIQGAGPIWQQMMEVVHSDPTFSGYLNGPNGQPIADDWPVPPDLQQRDICTATGHQATGNGSGDAREEWLLKDGGPSLPCDRVSDYEYRQLLDAMKDLRQNGGNYADGAESRVLRYASAGGVYDGDIPDFEDNSGDQSDNGDYDPNDEEVPIQQRDNG
jgi:membrane peptidoglycan carboxypeptidase